MSEQRRPDHFWIVVTAVFVLAYLCAAVTDDARDALPGALLIFNLIVWPLLLVLRCRDAVRIKQTMLIRLTHTNAETY